MSQCDRNEILIQHNGTVPWIEKYLRQHQTVVPGTGNEHYKTTYGVEFSSYSAMNEPYTDYWGAYSWKQEGCHFDMGESQSKMLLVLRSTLDANGLGNVQVSGTDETSIDVQILSYGQLCQEAKDVVDRIDTHTYGGSRREALRTLAETEGKNLWMSEVDGGDTAGESAGEMGAGLWLAQRIITDMNELRPSAWVMWQAIDNHVCAEGYQGRVDTGMPDVDLSAYSHVGDKVSVIRTSGDTASGEKWKESADIGTYGKGFYAELIPNSVTTYIVQDVY